MVRHSCRRKLTKISGVLESGVYNIYIWTRREIKPDAKTMKFCDIWSVTRKIEIYPKRVQVAIEDTAVLGVSASREVTPDQ